MIMLLCSGLNLRRSLSPALTVSLDYIEMQGLPKQKPGALSIALCGSEAAELAEPWLTLVW